MSENKYTYDAFISYRHTDPDNFIAETLHKMMESFKPPKKILTKEGCSRNKIERVFRDKDELPLASNLEEPIVEALSKSEFLVVICSPRLRESAWCQKEIQTFIEMHGKRKVLAVLAEGEPDESFPEELLYNEVVEKDADGNEIIKRQPVEPLAADFRGKTHKEIKKAMKSEILRLLAPMFNVSYDDLKQRHREQRLRKIIATSILAASLGIAFGVYSTSTAIKLNTQKKKIEEQATKLSLHQSEALAKEALEAFENDDRKSALSIGYAALTEYDGIKMPYTPEAEVALTTALSVYDGNNKIRAFKNVEMPSTIESAKLSFDKTRLLVSDKLGNLVLWDTDSLEELFRIEEDMQYDSYGFIDNDNIFYLSVDDKITKVNIETGNTDTYESNDSIVKAIISPDGKYILCRENNNYTLINTLTYKKDSSYPISVTGNYVEISNDSEIAYISANNKLHALNLATNNELYTIDAPKGEIVKILHEADKSYIVSYYSDSLLAGTTTLTAVEDSTGKTLFKNDYSLIIPDGAIYMGGSFGEYIMITSSTTALLANAKNGDFEEIYMIDDTIIKSITPDNDCFTLYTSNGDAHTIHGDDVHFDAITNVLVCHNLKQLEFTDTSILGIQNDSNRIIRYSYLYNADSYEYEDETAPVKANSIRKEDARSWALENSLPKANIIYSYLDIDEANIIVAIYSDNTVEFYRKESMELLNSISCPTGVLDYYGAINDRYIIGNTLCGYLIDENGNITAIIPDIAGISSDETSLVLYGKNMDRESVYIAVPVYTTEELVNKAKKNLDVLY